MTISEATQKRIIQLCRERNITINKLATLSGITQSTLNNIIKGNSKTPTLQTIVYLCAGFNIDLIEFFDSNLFNELDES